MRRRAYRLFLLGLCHVAAWLGQCCAQEAPPATPRSAPADAASEDSTGGSVKEATPDLYYMPDKDGKLQPVLGFKLEEFQRLLALRDSGVGPQRPGFRLTKLAASGIAGAEYADLSLQFTIFASDKNWVRVPLRLGQVKLREAAQYEGPSEHFLEYSDAEQGYVAWFRGETDQPLRLTLRVLAPLETSTGEVRLKLNAPRAVDSELILTAPQPQAIGQVSAGAFLQAAKQVEGGTEFKVLGLANDFSLSWREAGQPAGGVPTVLQALGNVLVRIDGRSVNTEATLQVSSFGGEFQEFQVRLPRGATLVVAGEQTDYRIEQMSDAKDPAAESRVVKVLLNAKTAGPVTVRLITEQGRQEPQSDEALELGGFDVEGAVRQWGHLAVAVSGDWQVAWGERVRVQQVDELPAELRRDDLVAGFEYYGQPYSLPARILPRKSMIGVEPQYLVQVGADRLQLDARLKYRIGGAKVFSLDVDLAGWEADVTSIGPAGVVNLAGIVSAENLPLTIPLTQPSAGEVVVTFRAFRKLPPEAKTLEFDLPQPRADLPAGAALVVLPADNVELTPRQPDLFGLSQQRLETELSLPAHQQEPWTYRADAAGAKFAADFHVHQRSIDVSVKSRLTLGLSGVGAVEQVFSYTIAREAVASLILDVPYPLFESGQIEVSLQDRTMPLLLSGEEEIDAGRPVRMRVDLPDQRIGEFELKVRYPLTEEQPVPQASVPFKAPLVMPGEGDCKSNELIVLPRQGVRVQLVDSRWTNKPPANGEQAGALQLTASAARDGVELGLRLEDRTAAESTLVERAWVQTWLTESGRLDRAVYQFTSRGRQFSLRLPAGVMGVQVTLDGRVANPRHGRSAEEHVVEWQSVGSELSRHVLEVRYQVADRGPRNSRLLVQLPEVTSAAAVRRTYWQLVLPRDEYLISGPGGATPEFTWGWKGLYWGRLPLLNEQSLEQWAGLTQHDTGLPQGVNRYLFSGSQMSASQTISTGSRSLVVLVSSGLVLLLGLLWIYAPAVRQPGLLFAGGVAALALGAWSPESALLFLQAATAGLALAMIAGLLERGVSRRRRRAVSRRGAPSSIVGRMPAQSPRVSVSPPSTETAVAMELSAPDAGP